MIKYRKTLVLDILVHKVRLGVSVCDGIGMMGDGGFRVPIVEEK